MNGSRTGNPGRPPALSDKQAKRLIQKAKEMIKIADAKYHVTAFMLKKALRFMSSPRITPTYRERATQVNSTLPPGRSKNEP